MISEGVKLFFVGAFYLIALVSLIWWLVSIWIDRARQAKIKPRTPLDHTLGEPKTSAENMPHLKSLQKKMMDSGHKCELGDGFLFLPDLFLAIAIDFHVFNQDENSTLLDFRFYFYGGLIDDALFANCSGMGRDLADAVDNALFNGEPMINAVIDSVKGHYLPEYNIESDWDGRKLEWHCLPSDLSIRGEHPEEDISKFYTGLVLPALGEYLGNKGFYLIKVYASKFSDDVHDIDCECRLDWTLIPEASELLYDYAQKWPVDTFRIDIQYIVLRQCRSHYQPAYDVAGIDTRTRLAINWMMSHLDSEMPDLMSMFIQLFENKYLAMEFYTFLPELCVPYLFPDLRFGDTAALKNSRDEEFVLKKTQMPFYHRLARNLEEHFKEEGLDEDKIVDLLNKQSGLGALIQKMIDEELGVEGSITFSHPMLFDDYTPFQPAAVPNED